MSKEDFGKFNTKTKWDYFKDNNLPVCVIENNLPYFGIVNKIDISQQYVMLKPSLIPDACRRMLVPSEKAVCVSFNSVVSEILESSLEEFAGMRNGGKQRGMDEKKRSEIGKTRTSPKNRKS